MWTEAKTTGESQAAIGTIKVGDVVYVPRGTQQIYVVDSIEERPFIVGAGAWRLVHMSGLNQPEERARLSASFDERARLSASFDERGGFRVRIGDRDTATPVFEILRSAA